MSTLTKTIKQYSFPFEKTKDFNFENLEKLGYEFRDTKISSIQDFPEFLISIN